MESDGGWTDEERRLLVECAVHAQSVTGHEIGDCARELWELIRAYREEGRDIGRRVRGQ